MVKKVTRTNKSSVKTAKTSKNKTKKAVTKGRAPSTTAKLRPRKTPTEITEGLKQIETIHEAIDKLREENKLEVDSQAVDAYLTDKRKEQGRDLNDNEKARIIAQDDSPDLDDKEVEQLKDFILRAEDRSPPFTSSRSVKQGSYAQERKFADTDFNQARSRIESLEDQIADATKRYLKTKRELILLTKTLERAYQEMDNNSSSMTDKEVGDFNVAHLSSKLFYESLN